jgi:hypothetical protein
LYSWNTMPMWRRCAQGAAAQLGQVHALAFALEPDRAAAGIDQAVDAADQGGLAGAGRADDGDQAGIADLQVDALEDGMAGLVFLDQALDFDGV